MAKVIEAVSYVQASTGRTFSPFSSYIPDDAVRTVTGFTIMWPDGTTGTGRVPFKTAEEAQAQIDRNSHFRGMSQG